MSMCSNHCGHKQFLVKKKKKYPSQSGAGDNARNGRVPALVQVAGAGDEGEKVDCVTDFFTVHGAFCWADETKTSQHRGEMRGSDSRYHDFRSPRNIFAVPPPPPCPGPQNKALEPTTCPPPSHKLTRRSRAHAPRVRALPP
jgi:hypothetical protein